MNENFHLDIDIPAAAEEHDNGKKKEERERKKTDKSSSSRFLRQMFRSAKKKIRRWSFFRRNACRSSIGENRNSSNDYVKQRIKNDSLVSVPE